MSGLTKEDLRDADVVDATELASPGTTTYITGATVVSTTAGTKRIVLSGVDLEHDEDERAEPKDLITLTGTSGGGAADGTYTIATVVDSVTVDVEETIATSTGGTADLKHPPGAGKVGFDPTGLSTITATNVQEALEELDAGGTGGGLTAAAHRLLDQLVHDLAEDYHLAVTYTGFNITNATYWTDVGKTTKIREFDITYTGFQITQVVITQYDGAGSWVERLTLTVGYTGFNITSVDSVRTTP